MRTNPFLAALLTVGGFALFLAFMIMLVVSEQTDYTTYDLEAVGELRAWTHLMVGIAALAFVGALVLAGIRWMLRDALSPMRADAVERTPGA